MSLWVLAHDAIHANVGALPPGQAAGYTTGSPDIRWTPQDWAAKPGAVRIDQDWGASDPTADVADFENGTMPASALPGWVRQHNADVAAARRPGQRKIPAIYESQSNVPTVVNALVRGGITSGVGLYVADWNLSEAQAVEDVLNAAGPFPVVGVQFTDAARLYDTDVFATSWLNDVVGGATPPPPAVPPSLVEGATGTWVGVLQHDLNAHGASPALVVDLDFGPKTLAAVEAFQRKAGLTVDGIVGPHTWAALGH